MTYCNLEKNKTKKFNLKLNIVNDTLFAVQTPIFLPLAAQAKPATFYIPSIAGIRFPEYLSYIICKKKMLYLLKI